MKICVIGDIHGRNTWKEFADIKFLLYAEPDAAGYGGFIPEYQKYVFVGDYVDSFTETNVIIKHNLLEIIRFKKLYPNHVELLWGNHDVNYVQNLPWQPMKGHVSGFRPEAHFELYDIFNTNKDLFQVAYQKNNYLFVHSGIHFGWYHFVFTKAIKEYKEFNDLSVAEQLNLAFEYNIECLHDIDWYRGGGNKVGGPLWADKQMLDKKPLKYTHQIVGHNPVDEIRTYKPYKNNDASITFIDVLHTKKSFYTVII